MGAKCSTSSNQKSEPAPALAQKIVMIEEELRESQFCKLTLSSILPLTVHLTLMTTTNSMLISHTDALLPPRTLPKELNNEQVVIMLNNLMGADYHHDIGRLTGMLYDHVQPDPRL